MKKKTIIILLLIAIVIAILATVVIKKNIEKKDLKKSFKVANIINKNSDLPVKYMENYLAEDKNKYSEKYEFINNYMSNDYSNKDIKFSYYGYPTDESGYYLASIKLLSSKYNLLGVKVGDKIEKSISKIEKYGFKVTKNNDSGVRFEYDDYSIYIKSDIINYSDDNYIPKIEEISISAASSYTGNRIY